MKQFFLQFLVDILQMNPHIFADPDPGSYNLTNSTEHCKFNYTKSSGGGETDKVMFGK